MNNAQVILNAAANYVESNGWTQGKNRERNGCVCVYQAIMDVTPWDLPVSQQVREALKAISYFVGYLRYTGIRVDTVQSWNDHHVQSEEDAIATLRAAAAWNLDDSGD